MKLKKLAMLALVAVLAVMALVACGPKENPDESSSTKPEESSSTTDTVTITYKWGVKSWGDDPEALDPTDYLYTKEVVYDKGDDASPTTDAEAGDTLDGVEGYEFYGWSKEHSALKDLQEDMVVTAQYNKLEKFTYTFKNDDGSVIKSGEAWEGSSIAAEAPATNNAVYYFEDAQKDTLKEPVAYKITVGTEEKTFWIEKADEAKLTTAVAMPIGSIFVDWKSSTAGSTINKLQANNVVFTARLSAADEIIDKIEAGKITKDNMLDKSLYTKLSSTLYKNIISNKIDGVKKDCSIIDKYADAAAAEKDGKKTEYEEALAAWNKYTAGMNATFYMAWDGEYIYFLAEIVDPKVVTQGSAYCAGSGNPYENDGVELWYAINNNYHKLCLDAMGNRLYSATGDNPSAYLDYVAQQGLAKAKVTNASGETVDMSDKTTPRVIEGATGYTVAFALPAYDEPADPTADLNNKANWGAKLERGATFYVSLQIDNVSAPGTAQALAYATANKGSMDNYNKSDEGKANGGLENNAAIARINLGWQTKSAGTVKEGTLRFALG